MSSQQRFYPPGQGPAAASSSSTSRSSMAPPPTKLAHYDSKAVLAAQCRQQQALNTPRRATNINLAAAHYGVPRNQIVASPPEQYNQSYSDPLDGDDLDYRMDKMDGWAQTRKRVTERPTGLRHFSTKVCEKVKQKGLTNYNEVADELVAEYFEDNMIQQVEKQEYEMKNIRRRVYDALNVLLAMNIITKNKKDIRWLGLPASSAQEIIRLEEEKTRREANIKAKLETLQEMIVQLVTYRNLVAKNRESERAEGRPDQHSLLYLPFLIVNTDRQSLVECSVSNDKSEYLFSFDQPFEIHDDLEVLKKMGLACGLDTGTSTKEQSEQAKSFLPALIRPYIDDILKGHSRAEEAQKNYAPTDFKSMPPLEMDQDEPLRNPMVSGQDMGAPVYQPNNEFVGTVDLEQQELLQTQRLVPEPSVSEPVSAAIQNNTSVNNNTSSNATAVQNNQLGKFYYTHPPSHSTMQRSSDVSSDNSKQRVVRAPPTVTRYYVQKSMHGNAKKDASGHVVPRAHIATMAPTVKYVVSHAHNANVRVVGPRTVQENSAGVPLPQRIVHVSAPQRGVPMNAPPGPYTTVRKVIRRVTVPAPQSNGFGADGVQE